MLTSADPAGLAADLSRMTTQPVSLERAEELLADDMAWLPQGEPLQCIAEDCVWEIPCSAEPHRLHRRTMLTRLPERRLGILVEVALMRPDGIELERREFDTPSGAADAYVNSLRERLSGKP